MRWDVYDSLYVVNSYRNGFQGMGYGLLPMLSGVAELVGRGIMAIVASNKKSYTMACMASPFAWIVATVLLIGLYFYVMKDMKRSCACKIEKQGLQSKRKSLIE
ncbi:MAG: hypothetical protein ACLTER_00930 [Ruminococcus sp.]